MEVVLIKDVFLATMDRKRTCHDDGAVAVAGDKIVAVGSGGDLAAKYPAARVIEGRGRVCLPGLINGHNHFEQAFYKGLTRVYCGDTFDWIRNFKIPLTRAMNAEDYYLVNRLACLELLRFGVTCSVNHVCEHDAARLADYGLENTMRAILDSGLRAEVVIGVSDRPGLEPEDLTVSAAEGGRFVERAVADWHLKGGGRLHVWAGPVVVRAASPELWRRLGEIVTHHRSGIHVHLNGGGEAVEAGMLGLPGPNFTAAHCQNLTPEEIALLAGAGASVVHNPTYILSYALSWPAERYGDGIAPVTEMLEAGVNVGIGTDGCLGDTQNLFREMRNIAFQQHYKTRDKTTMPPTKLLEMVTLGNARSMQWDHEIGSIEPGKKADLILMSRGAPGAVPWLNTPADIVYLLDGHDVDLVMVNGKVLWEDGSYKEEDVGALLERAQRAAQDLVGRAGLGRLKEKGWKPWNSNARFARAD